MLDKVEMDADTARLLRRFASRDGKGVSDVVQEGLKLYGAQRHWVLFVDQNQEPDESLEEEARLALLEAPVEARRLLLEVTELPPDERSLLSTLLRSRLGLRRAVGLAFFLWLVVVVSALWRLGVAWTP